MAKKSFVDYWRQLDFYDPAKDNKNVLIVGAGSTGSFVAYGLARMGVKDITVCDFDSVEAHNLPNQFFAESLIELDEEGKSSILKVMALKTTIENMVKNFDLKIIPDKVENIDLNVRYDVVISAVDSMEVRKWIYEKVRCDWIIDPRTGGEFFRMIVCDKNDGDDRKNYEKTLHSDGEASPLPCTGTAIIDVAMGVSAEVIQRYRMITKGVVSIMESFHDFKIGGNAGIMRLRRSYNELDSSAPPRTQTFIAGLGAQPVVDKVEKPYEAPEFDIEPDAEEFDEIQLDEDDEPVFDNGEPL